MRCRAAAAAVLLGLIAPRATQAWDLSALRALTGLTKDQWQAAMRGDPQARVLSSSEKREVAVAGVARVRATTACFVAKFSDIEDFKKNPAVLRIRKFTPPIRPRDLEGFRLEPRDLDDLSACRPGHCNVKLPATAMDRLARDVDWPQPDHAGQAQSIVREELLRYIEAYVREGNAGLIVYRDKDQPVSLRDEFRAVLSARPGVEDLAPEFHDYLARYPDATLPNVSDFFYWSIESFGLKPVSSVTHVWIYAQPGHSVIASGQIYASHYFDASSGLTAALDDDAGKGMYLAYLNRSRIDLLGGLLGGLRRAVLRGRLREGMRKNLIAVVRKLEASCADDAGARSIAP
ncbi:MAG TPA: hypothetical protein VHB50_11925 [Bryobacteraceae bacterium]|nr:hypothetical protein [Bryobacteraceae bacterium]